MGISKVYLSYKSDKKLLAAIASRQKGLKYLQFSSLFSDLIILRITQKRSLNVEFPQI